MTAAVELAGVGKVYARLEEQATLLTSLIPFGREKKADYWALRDISFRVEEGETVGLIGRNGAGKTTMLRLLAGVSRPSEGSLRVRGRIAPLISVGVGFHQEMTGRENVFVNGMLLGLTKRQLRERFDEIVDFAEIENFIDTPVKFYSSGMYMRLGFSVAAHVDPDVLLVDEVLAVGDISFQLKCIEKMKSLQRSGTTIMLVSHSMQAIRLLCPRAILIRKGRLEVDGTAEEAIARHHELMSVTSYDGEDKEAGAVFLERELIGPDGPTHHVHSDDPLVFRVSARFERDTDSPQAHFEVVGEDGNIVYALTSVLGGRGKRYAPGQTATLEVPFTARMGSGTYRLRLTLFDRRGQEVLAYDPDGVMMFLPPRAGVGGVLDLHGSIRIDGLEISGYEDLLLPTPGDPASPTPAPPRD